MDYEINLTVSPTQLKKYLHGFGYDTTRIDECINTNQKMPVCFIHYVKKQEDGILIEERFRDLVEEAEIEEHHDDLLYFILCANETAQLNLSGVAEQWQDGKPKALKQKAKELAKLLLLYRSNPDLKNIGIKFTPQIGDAFTVKSDALTNWIHTLIKAAAINNEFPSYGPDHYFGFLILDKDGKLNYNLVKQVADMPLGAISIDQKRILVQFILSINDFVSQERIFEVKDGVRYSSAALKFIYQICVLFGWLTDADRNGTDIDYMHGLIANYQKLYPDS